MSRPDDVVAQSAQQGVKGRRTIGYWVSLAFLATIPWEDVVMVSGVGTITRTVGMALAVFWVLGVLGGRKLRAPHVFHVILLIYVLWYSVSVLWTIDPGLTRGRISTYPQLLLFCYILWDLYRDAEDLSLALKALIVGFAVNIGSLVGNFLAGTGVSTSAYRFAATGADPNNNGVILAIGIPLAWYLFTSADTRDGGGRSRVAALVRFAYLSYIPIAVFGIFLTASRAALVTAMPALMFILLSRGRMSATIRGAAILILIVGLIVVESFVPSVALERLQTTPASIASGDLNGRVVLWRLGFDAFLESPILGVGGHAYRAATYVGKVGHSTYLSVLVELGIIGFVIFLILGLFAFYRALKLEPHARSFWVATLIVLGVGILTLNWEHKKLTWLIPTMVVIQSALAVTGRATGLSPGTHRMPDRWAPRAPPRRPVPTSSPHAPGT